MNSPFTIGLTFRNDTEPGTALAEIIAALPLNLRAALTGTHTYRSSDSIDGANVRAVLDPAGVPDSFHVDDEPGADRRAQEIGGLLVEWPVIEDHRKPAPPDRDADEVAARLKDAVDAGRLPTEFGAAPRALLLDPDCRDGKCSSCVGGPCEHGCHTPGAAT